jgi:hypothetical protein
MVVTSETLIASLTMQTIERFLPSGKSIRLVAVLALFCGVAGMGMSFVYLASDSRLDVLAGAAGFIAGSILIAGGLVSSAMLARSATAVADAKTASDAPPLIDVQRWLGHFRRNRDHRPEPAWDAPIALTPEVVKPLLRSLEQFQLGDGGGPASLIAWNAEKFRSSTPGTRALVDLWFAEEREHARLLSGAVARLGGTCIRSHWSFTAFCHTRRWLGVRFELTVLLLTEIVSTIYYRLIRRHSQDPALHAMCTLILRDEAGHVAFHRDRLARAARAGGFRYGWMWEYTFRTLGVLAGTMLWINHAGGLKAIGATRGEFYRGIWREFSRFIRKLRRDCENGE